MRKRYKIIAGQHGVSVWHLRDYGNGLAWDFTGRRFASRKEAEEFIKSEVKKNDSDRKSKDNTEEE